MSPSRLSLLLRSTGARRAVTDLRLQPNDDGDKAAATHLRMVLLLLTPLPHLQSSFPSDLLLSTLARWQHRRAAGAAEVPTVGDPPTRCVGAVTSTVAAL